MSPYPPQWLLSHLGEEIACAKRGAEIGGGGGGGLLVPSFHKEEEGEKGGD